MGTIPPHIQSSHVLLEPKPSWFSIQGQLGEGFPFIWIPSSTIHFYTSNLIYGLCLRDSVQLISYIFTYQVLIAKLWHKLLRRDDLLQNLFSAVPQYEHKRGYLSQNIDHSQYHKVFCWRNYIGCKIPHHIKFTGQQAYVYVGSTKVTDQYLRYSISDDLYRIIETLATTKLAFAASACRIHFIPIQCWSLFLEMQLTSYIHLALASYCSSTAFIDIFIKLKQH